MQADLHLPNVWGGNDRCRDWANFGWLGKEADATGQGGGFLKEALIKASPIKPLPSLICLFPRGLRNWLQSLLREMEILALIFALF